MFGPKQYLRTAASVDTYTDTFTGIPGNGTVIIQNGDGNGHNLVSDVLIQINGTALADWSKLLHPGYKLEDSIPVSEDNSILVIILGKPGSYLTIQAQAEVTPDATSTQVIGIGGGTVSVENHLGDMFTLTIPPLALDRDTTISASALPNTLPSPIGQNLYPGAVLGPEGLEFSLPATVTVSLHQPLNVPGALLFSLQDSDYALPTSNQTALTAQNSIQGEIYHFSPPISVELPTEAEIEGMVSLIFGQPYTTPQDLLDRTNSLLTLAKEWDLLGYEVADFDPMYYAITLLQDGAEIIVASPLPADPCGQYTLEMIRLYNAMDLLGCNACIVSGLDQDLLARTCKLSTSPQVLNLYLGETWQPGITTTLLDPKSKRRACSVINWYSANLNVVDIAAIGNFCIPTGVAPGVANVSANCEGQLAASIVKVCGLIGTYQGSYSGKTIACTEQGPGGCMKWGKPVSISGPATLVSTQTGTSVSAVINISGDPMEATFTGTSVKGKVSVTGSLLCHVPCGVELCPAECPAGLSGTLSSDCSTFSGSFYDDRPREAKGTFSLSLTTP